jgi:hypothetical protein
VLEQGLGAGKAWPGCRAQWLGRLACSMNHLSSSSASPCGHGVEALQRGVGQQRLRVDQGD